MNQGKDRFSGHSKQYAAFRPTYPKALYEFIFTHAKEFDTAWDAGTGNGQVARDLSSKFKKVVATDISAAQLTNAHLADNIFYSVAGEETTLPDKHVDLITVAQAIHWFNIPKFYKEVNRVANKEATLAVWGYSLLSISPEIDEVLTHFYTQIVGPYWDAERKLIDNQYKTIPFPFQEIPTPELNFTFEWTLEDFQGYLSTWSSVQKYIKAKRHNPVDDFIGQIKSLWKGDRMIMRVPLFLRLGKI